MATFTIAGNVVANNARLCLINTAAQNGNVAAITYSNASGVYTFSNVAPGSYTIVVDLLECVTAPYSTGYSYRNPQGVQVVSNNLTDVNFTPVLLNAVNPSVNAF